MEETSHTKNNNQSLNSCKLTNKYKQNICNSSYIGKKGYTIPKSILTSEDYKFLCSDLNVKPDIVGGITYSKNENMSFPVYRESNNKIYIPRFYGIQRYGKPNKCNLLQGDVVKLPFSKTLRDYQDKIVNVYTDHVSNTVSNLTTIYGNGGILEVPCGRGKCLGINTPILMFNGETKPVQDIVIGDLIMGDDSTPRTVLSLARGVDLMYKVSSSNSSYVANQKHILSLKHIDYNNVEKKIDITIIDYLKLYNNFKFMGYRAPVIFPSQSVDIPPYLLGYWLASNRRRNNQLYINDKYIYNYFINHPDITISNYNEPNIYNINTTNGNFITYIRNYELNHSYNFIPLVYKCNDRTTQLLLLSGIIDACGYAFNNHIIIIINKQQTKLIDDVIFLSKSLGFSIHKLSIDGCIHHAIYGNCIEELPILNPNIKNNISNSTTNNLNYEIDIKQIGVDNYYGFVIDGNRRFMLGDFTVTHNTVMALKIISNLSLKSLIIVHKEFLMNQWIERIHEFLPTARIGKIQGSIFDIANKDIVIGMIQTMYDKNYDTNAFDSFGLTVIDEVHRIGSEQFSKTLFKTITPYMLGISATVERKDNLTKLLYMFIGNKIYSEERTVQDPVCVRAIKYKNDDIDFNTTEYDFRGKPKYSSMIVKLCSFNHRSDFIIRVIRDIINENKNSQIMVLCHNRALLTYMYDAIILQNFATVGYYVGGMKQADLLITESKQIVLATYAMAAEALDIKTLSILVMATPKTDITQSVGRILRVKHDKPIIVDIIDSHDIFQNQWYQRKRYYKKCNYKILQCSSNTYNNQQTNWDTLYNPLLHNNKNDNDDIDTNKSSKCLIDTSLFDEI